MKMLIQQKIQLGFAAALVFLMFTAGVAVWSSLESNRTNRLVMDTKDALLQLQEILTTALQIETANRALIVTGDDAFLQRYQAEVREMARVRRELSRLFAAQPVEAGLFDDLEVLLERKTALAQRVVEVYQTEGRDNAASLLAQPEMRQLTDEIEQSILQLKAQARQWLQQGLARNKGLNNFVIGVSLGSCLLALVLVGLASVIVRRDLEKRQRAEAERDRFFTLALDMLCIAGTDGYFKRLNPAFQETLGWSTEEMLARPFLDFVHPDERAATLREMEKLAAGQPTLRFENRYQCKDGSWKWLSWRTMPQPDGTLYATVRDVTGLKLAEGALRRSEENLAVTLNSIGDAVMATDPDGRVTRLNPVAENLTGWTQAEALGRPVAEVFHIINEETRAPAVIPVEKVLATGKVQGLANHTVIIARDGTERPIADSAAPIRDKDGRILGVVLVFRDVTEEKKAERAIRESAERLQLATEAADIAVWQWNIKSGPHKWDERMFAIYGLPPKSEGRVNYEDWSARVLPADLAEQEAQLQRTIATCGRSQREFRIVRASDQAVRVIQAAEMAVAGVDGQTDRVVGINIDITERKQMEKALCESEERFRTAFEQTAVGIAHVGLDGSWLRVNQRLCEIVGYTTEELLAHTFQDITHPDDLELDLSHVGRLLAGEVPHYDLEKRYRRKDRSFVWVQLTVALVRKPSGEPDYFISVLEDITARKQAEDALRESEERFRIAAETANDVVYEWDLKQSVQWLGKIDEMLGYGPGEYPRTLDGFAASVHPEDQARVMAAIQAHLEGRAPYDVEYRVRRKDGVYRWWVARGAAARTPDGKPLRWIGSVTDITERKRAEQRLADFKAALDEHAIVAITGSDGNITYVNDKFCAISKYAREELLGQNHRLLKSGHHPEEFFRELWETITCGRVWKGQCKNRAKDGSFFWLDTTIVPFLGEDGKPAQLFAIRTDITASKRAEEEIRRMNMGLEEVVAQRTEEVRQSELRFRSAMQHSPTGMALVAPDGHCLEVNESLCRILGYPREELLTTPWQALTHPDDLAPDLENVRRLLAGEIQAYSMEKRYYQKNGREIWALLNVSLMRTPDDAPEYFITQILDLTERKQQEKLARRSQRMEAIGALAGGMAHDLNNALAPIMMSMELLRSQHPAESQVLEIIQACAQRGADMVRQLLTFAKGAEGARVSVNPKHLLKELQQIMQGTFPKNIQVAVTRDPKLPPVLGDPTQLHQILLNLCVNARDAMPHGGTLTLEAKPQKVDTAYASSIPDGRPGNYVILRVRDTGTGIPPEILDRIFDPFFTTKGPDKGTGLGLSTVMGIVKGHGGFVQAYSKPGQGSTFTVYLPAEQAGGDTELVTKTTVEFRGQEETILFVDDESAVRRMALTVLRRLNFTPLIATDGADGLIQVAQHRTELRAIITDLHMPHMDGLAFVRALRRLLPDIPIIVASGRWEEAVAEEFKTLGVTSRLDKPFTEAQLAEVLKTALTAK
jgi:PAS domain S-box-containing protein